MNTLLKLNLPAALCFTIAVAIALSAFGAHGLKGKLLPTQLESYHTACQYLLLQSIACLLLLLIKPELSFSIRFIFTGTLCFSVSIFLLLWFKNIHIPYGYLVPITPIGGTLMIIGWILAGIKLVKIL